MNEKNLTPDVCPLTDSQLGIYFDWVKNPQSLRYNITFSLDLPAGMDTARLTAAVKTVAARHPALFMTVGTPGGVPSMIPHDDFSLTVPEKTVDSVEAEADVFRRPFDPEKGPLCRFELLHTPKGDSLLGDVSHIVFDGTSVSVFLRETAAVYDGGEAPASETILFDSARREAGPKDPERTAALQRLFDEKFDGADFDAKPVRDRIDAEADASNEASSTVRLDAGTLFTPGETERYAKENGISENALFLGAFGYTLAHFNGTAESCFATAFMGRGRGAEMKAVGMYVKTLPFVCRFDENASPADYLRRVYDDYYAIRKNDCIPFAELAAKYGVNTDVTFVYQAELLNGVPTSDGTIGFRLLETGNAVSDLEVGMEKTADGFEVFAHYRLSEYTDGLARGFLTMFLNVVRGMMTAERLADVRFTDPETEARIADFNRTEKPYESERTVVDLFREQAKKSPEAECLVYEEKRFTYREIDGLTDRLAKNLRALGLKRGEIAGVLIGRCEYMLICSLGILKAGAAYLPLDPTYPPERLNLMMRDSGAMLLITTPELSGIITDDFTGHRMMTDEIPSLPDSDEPLPAPVKDDLFIMLYTSGSTGTPKGVLFAHSNTMVTAAWERDFYHLGPDCRVTAYASYGFDANVFDTYATITSGAALHIISDAIRLDLAALRDYFNENGVTHSTMTTQVGRAFALLGGVKTLRVLNVAGEKLTPLTPPENFALYNLYGPTEGSILATGFRVDRLYRDIPIGRPIDNVKLYVVDPCGRLLPPGAAGELWISGAHVTKGYRNRPEKTAEAYGNNPFCAAPGYERVYRTGDIVRLMCGGDYQFIGRRDGQVKVRGFRVELTEVEEVIRRFAGIKDATVAAFDEPSGGKFLAAYVVSDEPVDVSALNDFIRAEKPPYMVPAVTMQIERIPLNQNQKVNKRALPRPERKAENVTLPENDTQKKIYELACEVIGHSAFGVDTDLIEAGLTSIGTLRLNVALGEAFKAPMRLDDLKNNATVRKLEAFLTSAQKTESASVLSDYPITQTQRGIFVECSAMPDTVVYNIPLLMKLGGGVDASRLADAVKAALDAHPYAKTTLFADENGEVRARRNDSDEAKVGLVRTEKLPAANELVRPYQLLDAPLYRAAVYETAEGTCLYLDFHHIISDGTSEAVLLADIDRAYAGQTLKAETYTGFEAALDEEKARASERFARAKAYYDGVFTGCEADSLPPKAPEDDAPGAASFTKACALSGAAVKAFCEKHGLTPSAFFNAAFGFTLGRFGQSPDAVYTTVYHGRSDSRLASAFTMAVRTLPVLVRTGEDKPIPAFIRGVQDQLLDSMANDLYSFAEISRAYGIRSDLIFVYQGDGFAFDTLCGEPAESVVLPSDAAKAPFTLSVSLKNDTFELTAEYRPGVYGKAFVESFLDAFAKAAEEFLKKETLSGVSLVSDAAEKRLAEINDTDRPFENLPVCRFFERRAAAHPDKTAVIGQGGKLTYGELNRKANRIAHALIEAGVKKDAIVGMMLDRTVDIPLTELAILKAGGAFLGLLPSYPDDRLEFCLTDADSPLVVTTEELRASRPGLFAADRPYRAVTLDELLENENEEDPDLAIDPDSLAYCIYTSGSTGKPKGVMIEQRNLACLVQPADTVYSLYCGGKGGKVGLALSSITFDMSVFDDLLLLLSGMTVCIASEDEIHNPGALARTMIENRVDTFAGTPSMMTNYLSIPEFRPALTALKTMVIGAEAFPGSLYDELKKLSPGLNILNGYGPSECTVTCCAKELHSPKNITIGGPVANTAFYVVDRFGQVLPPYACGELIICGGLVGRGYVKLPERTAKSFYTLRGLPAYHSGDTVRLNADGEVEFFGRIDNQVKLRGFRVELDEIEKTICSYEGVKVSKVIVRTGGGGDYLAGFFTADRAVDLDALTAYLKSKLTYYMVPDVMAQLDAMPLTPSGKIDKKALPDIRRESRKTGGRRAPKKSLEEQLCDLFGSVLALEEYYADDNFFEMGGTSLTASKATMQLMSKGLKVEYQDIFDHPTPESLAAYIESQKTPAASDEKKAESDENDLTALLSHNTLAYAAEVKREPLGDVLLSGAVGFLGIHVLRELIDAKEGKIIALVRKGDAASPVIRLKNMLMYYFGETFDDVLNDRIAVLDADITDDDLPERLSSCRFDTLINCAACVKHYASDDIIEKINVHGVENLIRAAKAAGARMIQISTTSVPGVHTDETWRRQLKMHENELFVVDSMDNKYCISKYHAELKMLEAIRDGMRGKIIRVGNLMGRWSDGEFQINFNTNAFLHALRGFAPIGRSPISHATDPMSFSPIDLTARVIVLLAGTNDSFTAFHADNRFGFDEMQLIESCCRCGVTITPVPDEEYYADYYRMLGDEKINSRLSGLVTNDRPDLHMVETDNVFTANILYRLGFSWPLMDGAYLDRTIESLMTLDYFEPDDPQDY